MGGLTRCKLIYKSRRSQLRPDSTAPTFIKRRLKSKVHSEMVVREKITQGNVDCYEEQTTKQSSDLPIRQVTVVSRLKISEVLYRAYRQGYVLFTRERLIKNGMNLHFHTRFHLRAFKAAQEHQTSDSKAGGQRGANSRLSGT